MRRALVLMLVTLLARPALAQLAPTPSIAAPAPAPNPSLIRGLRINPGVMSMGAAHLSDAGWNFVIGYHVRLDLVLPGRLALGSELGMFYIPHDGATGDEPEWGAVTLAEQLIYQSSRKLRLAIGAGLALPGNAPALSAGAHLRFSCMDSGGGPCYWLQARGDLIGGVPVLGVAVQLGL